MNSNKAQIGLSIEDWPEDEGIRQESTLLAAKSNCMANQRGNAA
jgi:hypothetical protein